AKSLIKIDALPAGMRGEFETVILQLGPQEIPEGCLWATVGWTRYNSRPRWRSCWRRSPGVRICHLSARWPWVGEVFSDESEYQAALYAYYETMSFVEYV